MNGRKKVGVELDGVQDVEQEVNRRQRRVANEYAMGGIHLQSRRNRHQVYCLQGAYAMYVIEY